MSPLYDKNGDEIKGAVKFSRTRVIQYNGFHCEPNLFRHPVVFSEIPHIDLQFFTLTALRHIFPTFDNELHNRDGRSVAPAIRTKSKTGNPIYRIGDANCGVGTCMGDFFRSPNVSYPNGGCPEIFFCSRDGYERLLRYLVVGSSARIRRIAGTVTSLHADDSETRKVNFVAVSLSDGKKIDIPSALVVGEQLFVLNPASNLFDL